MSLFLVELIFGWAYTVYDFEQLFYRSKDIKKGLAEVLRRCLAELRKGLAEVLRRSCGGLAELSTGLAEVSCGAPQGSCGGLAEVLRRSCGGPCGGLAEFIETLRRPPQDFKLLHYVVIGPNKISLLCGRKI